MIRNLLFAALLCAGCAGLMAESGSWGSCGCGGDPRADHGIFDRSTFLLTHHDKSYLMILTAGGKWDKVGVGPEASGYLVATDGRRIEWRCLTRDGVTGKVVVGDQTLRLEDGGFVFVNLSEGRTIVEQAVVDLALVPQASIDEVRAVAAGNPRVAGFLKVSESVK